MARISKKELIKLQKTLKSDAKIGEKFGITRQSVQYIRLRYGIPSSYAGNAERNKEIIALFKKGISAKVPAKKFSLTVHAVYKVLRNAGFGRKKPVKKSTARKDLKKKTTAKK